MMREQQGREQNCDLHTHSKVSDGTLSPEALAERAKEMGLGCVALTDHNTALGLRPFLSAARRIGQRAVAGVECSADFEGRELHVLGLFLPERSFDTLEQRLLQYARAKQESNRSLAKALTERGFPMDADAMEREKKGAINRAHFAAELVKMGAVKSKEEAFDTLLSPEAGLYVPPIRMQALEAVSFLRELGAVPVWAHPFLDLDSEGARAFLPLAKERGLLGMEVLHPAHSPAKRQEALSLCEAFDLLPSGGSDFHGANKVGIELGWGRGDLSVPLAWADALERRS